MAYNVELRTKSSAGLTPLHPKTNINMVEGLLGADNKIISSLLPSWLVGGMKFIGTKSGTATLEGLFNEIKTWLEEKELSTVAPYDEFKGKYFVVGGSVGGSGLTLTREPQGPFDWDYPDDGSGEENPNEMVLEPGDWVVYSHYSGGIHFFGFVNNTYRDAKVNEAGVIKIATESEAKAGSIDNKAMTPLKVKAFVDNASLNASNLLSGTVPNARLSSDIPRTYTENIFTVKNTFNNLVVRNADVGHVANIKVSNSATRDVTVTLPTDGGTLALKSQIDSLLVNQEQLPNIVYAGPISGAKDYPSFRPLVENDIPLLSMSKISGLQTALNSKVPNTITINGYTLNANVILDNNDVGLGNVQNYSIALESDVKANAASISDKYMTPKRTKEAIDYWATIPVYESELSVPSDLPEGKLFFVKI